MRNENEAKSKELLSDEAIINLYWEREEKAISATDDKYGRYLYKIAYNILNDHMDCEECLDDTYLGAWYRIPPERPHVFQVFLSRIMRNTAVDKYRKNTASRRVPSELLTSLDELDDCIPGTYTVEEEYMIREMGRVLNTYLHALSERDMFIFVCRYYYADPINSIANMLQVSGRTVYRDLERIRAGLKVELEKEGIQYE